jgi:Holliday junction resolvase RusA-like endonuclease
LYVEIIEYRVRPKSHYGKKGLNKKGRETPFPTMQPDCLKIARAIEDALTKVIYRDDAQIVQEYIRKVWGDTECTFVAIREVKYGQSGENAGRSPIRAAAS